MNQQSEIRFESFYTLADWQTLPDDEKVRAILSLPYIDQDDLVRVSDNLNIFNVFIAQAHRVRRTGRDHYSASTLIHWIRHETVFEDDCEEFKINNNLSPKLSRVSMAIFPELNGFFETRDQQAGGFWSKDNG